MKKSWKKRLTYGLNLAGPFLGLILVYLVFLALAPAFSSVYNTKTILTQAVIIGIGALGMTLVIISGGIDLSAGSLIALGTVITGLVLRDMSPVDGPSIGLPLVAALAAVAVCAFSAFISGTIIVGLRIVPFIVTLGMMQIARGVAKGLADQTMVNTPRNWLENLMIVEPTRGVWYSVAPAVWIMVLLAALMFVVLRYTVFGRHIYAVGSNDDTARLCGVRVGLTRLAVFICYGALVGVASVMQYSNLTLGDPTAAEGMELDIIAAVVIGGGSLSGGEGSVVGSLAGALIMAVLRNGCQLLAIPNYVQNIVIGAIIIVAVGVDRFKHGKQI